MKDVQGEIKQQVLGHEIVLYMKGTPEMPQCGFSSMTVQCLTNAGAKDIFAVDVLKRADIRQGIKEFSKWPTIPQLYIKGKFIGGCDIVKELFDKGELQKMLQDAS